MIHKVKSGDTLAKIAKAHGITLARLLDANPRFKANPNRIRVGDVVNIPDGQPAKPQPQPTQPQPPAPQPPAPQPTPPPQPQPPASRVLGKLSERYETGGRGAGTVSTGAGDAGGVSYGSYQMTSKPNGGTVKRFVSQPDFPFRDQFRNLTPGGSDFSAVWKRLAAAQPEQFQSAQHDYIKKTHFDPLVQKIINEDGLNVLTRSGALQDVIWSTAVQHGPANSIPHRALAALGARPEDADFDRLFITAIYAERGRKRADGALAYFSRNSPAVQNGVARRFRDELKDALRMLEEETAGR
ncbi:MAG TPA: LysM peptidoglycan-binding domain-containing protein [Pyrinomonadaceae bacterium]|nr:LysM peptidoglycan-binding domain-containing protein [Pyrinomonadaceae bacterium]HWS99886.1 LysM peptidoglycan-binding domain-containing protein [Pyrinomonadaceae bacterium]